MSLTTNYLLRKPAGTDGASGPTAVGNLADDIDAALLAAINKLPKGILARGQRVTDSTVTGTEAPVLRIDNVSVTLGRAYKVCSNPIIMASGTINNLLAANIRFSTAGFATTGSTLLTQLAESSFSAGGAQRSDVYQALYIPSATFAAVSFLLSVQLLGTVSAFFDTNGINDIHFWIEDIGIDPGDTGIDL